MLRCARKPSQVVSWVGHADLTLSGFIEQGHIATVYEDDGSPYFILVAQAEIVSAENHGYVNRGYRRYESGEESTSNASESLCKAGVIIPWSIWDHLNSHLLPSLASFKNFTVHHEVQEGTNRDHASEKRTSFAISRQVEADRENAICLDGICLTKRVKEALRGNKKKRGNVCLMTKVHKNARIRHRRAIM